MSNISRIALNIIGSGSESQSFLGATWIQKILAFAPSKYQRNLALSILSWSPHYFYRNISSDYNQLTHREFTEREFFRNKQSREKLCELLLTPYLSNDKVVLDYGCGPGFLARSVSEYVGRVHAVDISRGALECARILNNAPNLTFLHTSQLDRIEDSSVDVAYSIAVIQHLTDSVFEQVLKTIYTKIKDGGIILLHIVVEEQNWRTERDWQNDRTIKGRMKMNYGLNCFSRRKQAVIDMVREVGFSSPTIQPMKQIISEDIDDIWSQHLLHASKKGFNE